MKKSLHLLALIVCAILAVGISTDKIQARLTGTNPGTDVRCDGPSGLEVCIDVLGNVIPTTTNVGSLGTSSLKFKDLNLAGNAAVAGTLTVTGATTQTGSLSVGIAGSLLKVPVATQTVTSGGTIDLTGACGGLVRLKTTNGNVTTDTTNTVTAPTSANTGCIYYLVNVTGTGGAITLDDNTLFNTPGGSIPLGTNDGAIIIQVSDSYVVLGTSDN